MKKFLKLLIRYGLYPSIMSLSFYICWQMAQSKLPYWPTALLIIVVFALLIAAVEKIMPYQSTWLDDHQDSLTDLCHALVNVTLIVCTAEVLQYLSFRQFIPQLWPSQLPIALQIIGVGLIIDAGLWAMHYYSHKKRWLWKLHAIHHQSERLYWLNAEKRHPLSALALAMPSLIILSLLGAPPLLIGCWMSFMAVHLSFQHANIDYRLGPFKYLLAVAEVHRWHHKYGFGQKNFGEVFVIWDHIFKTFHYQDEKIKSQQVGLRSKIPKRYLAQMKWPFQK